MQPWFWLECYVQGFRLALRTPTFPLIAVISVVTGKYGEERILGALAQQQLSFAGMSWVEIVRWIQHPPPAVVAQLAPLLVLGLGLMLVAGGNNLGLMGIIRDYLVRRVYRLRDVASWAVRVLVPVLLYRVWLAVFLTVAALLCLALFAGVYFASGRHAWTVWLAATLPAAAVLVAYRIYVSMGSKAVIVLGIHRPQMLLRICSRLTSAYPAQVIPFYASMWLLFAIVAAAGYVSVRYWHLPLWVIWSVVITAGALGTAALKSAGLLFFMKLCEDSPHLVADVPPASARPASASPLDPVS